MKEFQWQPDEMLRVGLMGVAERNRKKFVHKPIVANLKTLAKGLGRGREIPEGTELFYDAFDCVDAVVGTVACPEHPETRANPELHGIITGSMRKSNGRRFDADFSWFLTNKRDESVHAHFNVQWSAKEMMINTNTHFDPSKGEFEKIRYFFVDLRG